MEFSGLVGAYRIGQGGCAEEIGDWNLSDWLARHAGFDSADLLGRSGEGRFVIDKMLEVMRTRWAGARPDALSDFAP